MGSGDSFKSYAADFSASRALLSSNLETRRRAHEDRAGRLESLRSRATDEAPPPPKRKTSEVYDEKMVRRNITSPAEDVETVYVVLIDNSGSNRAVAQKLRQDSGYLTAFLKTLDPKSQVAFIYFSDHCDGERIMQEIDFVYPDENGDKVICSTLHQVYDACGGDAPEAIECVLWRACEIEFANAKKKHLILVTDVVAHGMGIPSDDGCPSQRDWRDSLRRVGEIYTTFTVVGSGDDHHVGELQKKFVSNDRIGYDLIDLSSIKKPELRLGMVANAVLFLMARHCGEQPVELFLSALYEKWLKEPIFGSKTDSEAKKMIKRLAQFLDWPREERDAMVAKVLGDEVPA